jgi:hypothetical protein
MESPPKKTNNNGSWQVITMSNLVNSMLSDMKQQYDENNSGPACAEQVNWIDMII